MVTCVSMCECDDNSVIISCSNPAKVFKFNLTSGAVDWCNTNLTEPFTVRCYGKFVFVSGGQINKIRIFIINSETGVVLVCSYGLNHNF